METFAIRTNSQISNERSQLFFIDSLHKTVTKSSVCTFSGGKPVERLTRLLGVVRKFRSFAREQLVLFSSR